MEMYDMKKKIFIVVGILLLIGIIYFVCFYRGTTGDNKKTLTVAEEITLNDNEKELLAELVNVNNQLLNPKQEENTNTTDYVEVAKPTEPVALKDFCKKVYEARKTTNEQGETIYLFDMDTMGNDNKIVVSPSRWNNDGYNSNLVQKGWVLIEGD